MKRLKAIEDARRQAGMTQSELAKAIGATQPIISNWERGATKPSVENLYKVSQVLKVPMEDLLTV